jgi:hypothetical protein
MHPSKVTLRAKVKRSIAPILQRTRREAFDGARARR